MSAELPLELARVRCVFQARAIQAHMGIWPTAGATYDHHVEAWRDARRHDRRARESRAAVNRR